MALLRRRRKAVSVPAAPLRSPATQLAIDIDQAATALAKAVKTYATAPDEIPAAIRADYAAGIALGAFTDLLAGVHIKLDLRPDVLAVDHEQRVLHALVVTHGLSAVLSNAATRAHWYGRDPRTEIRETAELMHLWIDQCAHMAAADTE